MTKNVNAHINFKENCEYKSSSIDRIISIEPQPVDIELTIINKNENHHYTENYDDNPSNNVYFFDDLLEIQAYVFQQSEETRKDIQVGRIEFYYQPNTSNKQILLNNTKNSCLLSKHGVAAIQYKPNQPGQIIAKYVDDKEWYAPAETFMNINLEPIPVTINFTKKPPYIVDLKDSVELEVEVKKKYPNPNDTELNYGVVTFLHYIEHFDMNQSDKRIEHVIGNPVLVRDGKAKIKYIPVQEYNDLEPTDLIDGTEYIRAVYNYDNDLYYSAENDTYSYESINYYNEIYTHKWQYFGSANVYTNIEIYKPNSVVLGISNKSADNDGRYSYTENSNIDVTATLINDKGQEIILPNESTKNLTFHVIGTYFTLSNNYLLNSNEKQEDYLIYHEYEKDLTFDTYYIEYDGNNKPVHGYFKKRISNLKPGNYTIQASTKGQIVNGEVLIYPSNTSPTVTEIEYNDETHIQYDTESIRTDEYLDSIDISNKIYINSTFTPISYNITTTYTNDIIKTKESINNYISSDININNSYKQILNNQRCYFYSPKTNETYIGKLLYTSSSQKLQGVLTDNISFQNAGDYPIYMCIPAGYYTNGNTIIYLDYNPSNTVLLNVRNALKLNLDYTLLSETSLGEIEYVLSSDDIVTMDTTINATVTLKKNNTVIYTRSYTLNKYVNKKIDSFVDLNVGDYTITAYTSYSNYTVSKNFTILPDSIQQQLQPNSKIIRATPYGTIDLILSSHSTDLTLLNPTRLIVYINKNTDTFDASTAEVRQYLYGLSPKYITADNIYLTVNAGTYLPTQLLVTTYYQGDSNIKATLCDSESCNTILLTPTINVDYETNDSVSLYLNDHTINNIVVIGKIVFKKDNQPIDNEKVFISSPNTDIYIQNIPEACNNIELHINPYDNELMNIISGNNPKQTLINTFGSINCSENANNTCNIDTIVQQYNDSNHVCLFPLLDNKVINFARNIKP